MIFDPSYKNYAVCTSTNYDKIPQYIKDVLEGYYENWTELGVDWTGTATENRQALQFGPITQTSRATISIASGGYKIIFDGQKNILNDNYNQYLISIDSIDACVKNFNTNLIKNKDNGTYSSFLLYQHVDVNNCVFNGNNLIGAAKYFIKNTTLYNNLITNYDKSGISGAIYLSGTSAPSTWSNLTFNNNQVDFRPVMDSLYTLTNNYMRFTGTPTTGGGNSSPNTSAPEPNHNISPAAAFQDLVSYIPKRGGPLDNIGVAPTIPGHYRTLNNIPLVPGKLVSGANGVPTGRAAGGIGRGQYNMGYMVREKGYSF